jgi:hypothetical protein
VAPGGLVISTIGHRSRETLALKFTTLFYLFKKFSLVVWPVALDNRPHERRHFGPLRRRWWRVLFMRQIDRSDALKCALRERGMKPSVFVAQRHELCIIRDHLT